MPLVSHVFNTAGLGDRRGGRRWKCQMHDALLENHALDPPCPQASPSASLVCLTRVLENSLFTCELGYIWAPTRETEFSKQV